MADRTCAQCGRVFRYPSDLRSHLQRKTPCSSASAAPAVPELHSGHPCPECSQTFTTVGSLRRHMRRSAHVGASDELSRLRAVIEVLTRQVDAMSRAPQPETIRCENLAVSNYTVDRRHITVNVFGQENLDHITTEAIAQILSESHSAGAGENERSLQAVVRTAMLIYSDRDHPENITCYLPSKRNTSAMVRSAAGWESQPAALVLSPVMQNSLDVLFRRQPHEGPLKEYASVLTPLVGVEDSEELSQQLIGRDGSLRAMLYRNKSLAVAAAQKAQVSAVQAVLAAAPVAGAP